MLSHADLTVRTLDRPSVDPATAYWTLRSFTPERASFLFESLDHGTSEGRYSIVGYRVRQVELSPPGIDAIKMQAEAYEGQAESENFAAGMALAAVGYLSAGCGNVRHRLGLCDDEGPSGQFAVGATVMVYDHAEQTVTVAGPTKGNLVERLIWELGHGPEPTAEPPEGATAPKVVATLDDERLTAKARRAKPYLEELGAVVLAQTYVMPIGEIDHFDVYRALRRATSGSHGYYIDLGSMPGSPDTRLAGIGSHMLHLRRPLRSMARAPRGPMAAHGPGAVTGIDAALGHAIPHPTTTGSPPVDASKALRKLEEISRQLWGGAVGYVCPGGAAAFVLADEMAVAQVGQIFHTVGVRLDQSTDPTSVPDAARTAAAPGLAAIAAAMAR